MSKQEGTLSSQAQRPTTDDRDDWCIYWQAQKQCWRTEPEIEPTRQEQLKACLANDALIKEGKYPFKGMTLNRADVEWLLATHENGRGPVDWSDENQRKREGLDLRGAKLQGAVLNGLPLARMRGGLTPEQWREQKIGPELRNKAAVHLEGARLEEVCLEGSILGRAYLTGADLFRAKLEQAVLHGAHLEGANLYAAHLEGADLRRVFLDTTTVLERTVLRNAEYGSVKLADVRWNSVNLAVVEWRRENNLVLGDESRALNPKEKRPGIRLHYFNAAIRANNQVTIELRGQGLNDEAEYFAYRAQKLRRKALWWQALKGAKDTPENESMQEGQQDAVKLRLWERGQKLAAGIFSSFLEGLSGYGYRPQRCLYAYVALVLVFAVAHYIIGKGTGINDFWNSIFMSIQAFHGRPFSSFSLKASPSNPYLVLDSIEAIVGLLIEALIVAIFTQRFLGR